MKRLWLLWAAWVFAAARPAFGETPLALATVPWPRAFKSSAWFDEGSRGEILSAWQAMLKVPVGEPQNLAAVKSLTGIDHPDLKSYEAWRLRERGDLAASFQKAAAGCATTKDATDFCPDPASRVVDMSEIAATGAAKLPAELRAWSESSRRFHEVYAAEQARLAALFPHVTSEIAALDRTEVLGDAFPDREFLLTFDDGPAAGTATADVAAIVRKGNAHATFFLVGDNLAAREKSTPVATVKSWYDGMCIGWHGKEHVPHVRRRVMETSLAQAKVKLPELGVVGDDVPFRPPYGQRSIETLAMLQKAGYRNWLWNLSSEDWSSRIDAAGAALRIETLILTKRHGIILFHDIHPKAKAALPRLFERFSVAGVTWSDCRANPARLKPP